MTNKQNDVDSISETTVVNELYNIIADWEDRRPDSFDKMKELLRAKVKVMREQIVQGEVARKRLREKVLAAEKATARAEADIRDVFAEDLKGFFVVRQASMHIGLQRQDVLLADQSIEAGLPVSNEIVGKLLLVFLRAGKQIVHLATENTELKLLGDGSETLNDSRRIYTADPQTDWAMLQAGLDTLVEGAEEGHAELVKRNEVFTEVSDD